VATYYEVLGVAPSASVEEIRRAYLAKARTLHPDVIVGASAELRDRAARGMQAVNEAWGVLRDPAKRRAYDSRLRTSSPEGRAHPAPPRGGPSDDWEPIERDEPVAAYLVEDEPRPSRASDLVMLVPAAIVALSAGAFVLSLVLANAALLATSFATGVLGGAAFVLSPFFVMIRQRGRH
jgi:hypothetical protein